MLDVVKVIMPLVLNRICRMTSIVRDYISRKSYSRSYIVIVCQKFTLTLSK